MESLDGVTVSQQLSALSESMNGADGAVALGGVAVASQFLMRVLRNPRFQALIRREIPARWRLVIVSAMSVAGGVLALREQGVAWDAALLHSSTLAAAQVLVHNVWTQFGEPVLKKEPTPDENQQPGPRPDQEV